LEEIPGSELVTEISVVPELPGRLVTLVSLFDRVDVMPVDRVDGLPVDRVERVEVILPAAAVDVVRSDNEEKDG